jgi:FtsH-binding integral membrane protein
MHDSGISIWFFIGLSLLVNGILITGAGIWEIFRPPANPVVLYRLHASVWWGILLLLFGLRFCIRFARNSENGKGVL